MPDETTTISTLEALAHRSHGGELGFGELVPRLAELGVESYHADYRRRETTYYFADGATHVIALPCPDLAVAAGFDGIAVQAAVAGAQQGTVRYPEFVLRTLLAGCVGYHVWISGRRVDYHGRRGELHVEHFPGGAPVRPAVEVVQRVYEAFRRKDVGALAGLIAPDVVIDQSSEVPWGGHFAGTDAMPRFFGGVTAYLDSTLAFDRFIDAGDHVVALGRTRGRVRATGAAYDVPIAHVWTVVDGRVTRVRYCIDNPTMLAALAQAR